MNRETNTNNRKTGQVKWFNNKAGYGFITVKSATGEESDIFTHYSTVHVKDTQYKFLVQGEYVEFDLVDSTSENHQFQATNVTGIGGGKLMCETRQLNRSNANASRSEAPSEDADGEEEYTKVQKKRTQQKVPAPPGAQSKRVPRAKKSD